MQEKDKIKPIIVGLSGGLGNQMFQYAAARALAFRIGCDLKLDVSWFYNNSHREFGLSEFRIDPNFIFDPISPKNSFDKLINKLLRHYSPYINSLPIYREKSFQFDVEMYSIDHSVYLEGYWQSYKYFSEIREILLSEFYILGEFPSSYAEIMKKINLSNSVCIHVRRGDYVSNRRAAGIHGLCTIEYYYKSMKYLLENNDNLHFFIFSDDESWVKENFIIDVPFTIIKNISISKPHFELMLMASCKNFIIANSSLSWWAAWLCKSDNNIVIAPQKWFVKDGIITEDLIPTNWKRL